MLAADHVDRCLARGQEFPFDCDDDDHSQPAQDWAHRATRGVLADLTDRRGIRQELNQWDTELRQELVDEFAQSIREAAQTQANGWPQTVAQTLYDNLAGRSGVGDQMASIDADIQEEICTTLAAIIERAHVQA